jgi:hypothetical protein
MSPEQQQIAIATACGWINVAPVIVKNVKHEGDDITVGISSDDGWIPDYLGDLNAMHEAEKVLTAAQRITYADQLCILWTGSDDRAVPIWFWLTEATAAQRAEAFLRTLRLWQETPTQPQ